MTKANAAAIEQMGDFFAALQECPNLIRKLIIEMRRQKCARAANRGQFDRVREYTESRLYALWRAGRWIPANQGRGTVK